MASSLSRRQACRIAYRSVTDSRRLIMGWLKGQGHVFKQAPRTIDLVTAFADHPNRPIPVENRTKKQLSEIADRLADFLGESDAKILRKKPPRKVNPSVNFLHSDEWRTLRYQALVREGGACQCCGRTRKTRGVVLHVDHILPRSKFPELALVLNNLQVLCEDCNIGKSDRDATDWR